MPKLMVAFCTYNRATRLPALVNALRQQACPVSFEILAVNNNSKDNTLDVLKQLAQEPGVTLRFVTENQPGIVPARNRAIEECLNADYMLFLDDDELPRRDWLAAAHTALTQDDAACVGGRVTVNFAPNPRPPWLGDELLGFLAEVDYGALPFWIKETSTPVWTANVAYRMAIFRADPTLRFDLRYNRQGNIGGGEDAMMFRRLLDLGVKMRYAPSMIVEHFVEPWRLHRRYFLRLHYAAGRRVGQFAPDDYPTSLLGVPPFMFTLALRQWGRTAVMYLQRHPQALRQAMNATHSLGQIAGRLARGRGEDN
ncbi:MAG: glycosyltransferase [Pseudomonadota bacterium]